MSTVSAYAATEKSGHLTKTTIERRDPGPHDVAIDIKFAGICHSDIHTVKAEWGTPKYPVVPGHEIAGVVTAVGSDVTKYQVGDHVGVGCMVNSCGHCSSCRAGLEQYCKNGATFTYNSIDKDGTVTQGGYSQAVVVNENFVVRIPTRCHWTPRRRCCAPASPCFHRCGTGRPEPAPGWRSSAWAASDTWASSSVPRWALR